MSADFDPYADRYRELVQGSIGFSGQDQDFFVEARSRRLLDLARRRLGDPGSLRALDVGCGLGLMDRHLGAVGNLEGVDLSERMVEAARRSNPDVRYHVADGARLPFDDASFDLAFTACVLHHVPPEERPEFVGELRRVTRPGGLAVVFEHNPLNPLTRLAVSRCEFDEDAILLGRRETRGRLLAAGLRPAEERYILFFPWRGSVFARAEGALRRVPMGAQYYVAAHA
jgi:SAM-dependent methyltransferase